MTNKIQLHVGYVGITREGKRVEIVRANNNMWTVQYPWTDDDLSWCDNGAYHADSQIHNFDIVGPWVEEPVGPWVEEPVVDYNDGNVHRWSGGECPVHEKSEVEALYIEDVSVVTETRSAGNFFWEPVNSMPIIAFKVVKPYAEPRDFWISMNDYQAHDTEADAQAHDKVLGCHHGYIHVKEVI
jgi:hypothetical protein